MPSCRTRTIPAMAVRASFRGFEIVSRGRSGLRFDGEEERLPELFVRGERLYTANLNPEHPVGTIQSIEHTLRSLERMAEEERDASSA